MMFTTDSLALSPADLQAFCRKHLIRKLALYGSILRDDFGPESDVDVLVEFQAGAAVDLFDMVAMENELSGLMGRQVDLRTPEDLSRYFRQQVVDSAQVLYERA